MAALGYITIMTASWAEQGLLEASSCRKCALASASLKTSARSRADSMPSACPAEAAPAVPVTASSVTGPTDLCVPMTGTRMTMTAGASRPSVSSNVASP